MSDKTIAINEFRRKFGQLLYLENLRNSEVGKIGGGENPEPCPICQKSLGTQWSVLQVSGTSLLGLNFVVAFQQSLIFKQFLFHALSYLD